MANAEYIERSFGPKGMHTRLVVNGECRQLFARDTTIPEGSPLVYIHDGEAEALRADARSGRYVCPFPGCLSPQFTTSGGSRRDHFVHLCRPATPHAPERLAHFQGKHLLGRWAASRYPSAVVRVDDHRVACGRQPDVLVTFPSGEQTCFEIQYSPLTVREWESRHADYASCGISDTWLFGHLPPYGMPSNRITLSDLHPVLRAALKAGVDVWCINPFEERVTTWVEPVLEDVA